MIKFKLPEASLICLSACLLSTQLNAADVSIHKNEKSGLYTWTAKSEGFVIELIQLLPDFVRAVYAKHDFSESEIERIASYCVFGTVIQNTSQKQLTYKVSDWHYTDKNGKTTPVKTKSQWLEEWQKVGITFSWTLLPGEGDFGIGDWQQGFTTIKLPRNASFDLTYNWTLDGKPYTDTLKDLRCAPENVQ